MKTIVAIATIGILALCAVFQGVNGNILYVAIVSIAGLGGYEVHKETKKLQETLELIKREKEE